MKSFEKYPGSKLIGISGTLGAGKDTAARYLMERGFMHVSTGDVLRAEATRRGLDHERPTLIELGVELREQYGSVGALVLKGIEAWETQQGTYSAGLVISGLRILGEVQELKAQQGRMLFIDAPAQQRYDRLRLRNRGSEDSKSVEEFIAHERVEMEGLGGPDRPHLLAVRGISDAVIENAGTETEFYNKLSAELRLAA